MQTKHNNNDAARDAGQTQTESQASERTLLDRMAEALCDCANSLAGVPRAYCKQISNSDLVMNADSVLAEYRNRPPEISQETALELLRTLKEHTEWMESDGMRQDGAPIHDCDFIPSIKESRQ